MPSRNGPVAMLLSAMDETDELSAFGDGCVCDTFDGVTCTSADTRGDPGPGVFVIGLTDPLVVRALGALSPERSLVCVSEHRWRSDMCSHETPTCLTAGTLDRMDRRLALAAGLDTGFVVLFVAIGRRNHNQDPGVSGLIETAAPFIIALAVAWVVAQAWKRPTAIRTGLIVWPLVVAVGMVLRRFVFDDGTAASFVIVATVFLGVFLIGWRAAAALVERSRRSDDSTPAAAH